MPLFYQQNINQYTRLAIWKIEEDENFFSQTVPLQQTITHPHKRLQHLAGRFLLRYLFPAFPFDEILIADTRKPYLPTEAYHFSISHCGDYAAAIVSTKERVGVDIEIATNRVFSIIHKFLSEAEKQAFNFKEPYNNNDAEKAILLWSVKEAMFKWWGNGNIDFKTMLQINFSEIKSTSSFSTIIYNENICCMLTANYEIFKEFCLVYIHQ